MEHFQGISRSSKRAGEPEDLNPGAGEKLKFENGRATGLALLLNGEDAVIHATMEVIMAAGAIGSPQLLQLSGVGSALLLNKHGIDVIHELPGVGENLQDHLQIRCAYKVQGVKTLNEWTNSLAGKITMALEYAAFRSGPMSMAPSQLGAFAKSDPALGMPKSRIPRSAAHP